LNFIKNFFQKTASSSLTVSSPNGFHLRPIASFVNETKKYSEKITLKKGDKEVDAKSINTLLTLALEKDDDFELVVTGKDPQQTLEQLKDFFMALMHQERVDTELKNKEVIESEKQKLVENLDSETSLSSSTQNPYTTLPLKGKIISKGIAIAKLYQAQIKFTESENPLNFEDALKESISELEKLYKKNKANSDASIYLAHKTLLEDETIQMQKNIDAFNNYIKDNIQTLKATAFDARRADYLDIQKRVLSHMGQNSELILPDTPFILFTDDLLPSEVATLSQSAVLGVVLKKTSLVSHAAILLKSFSIPTIVCKEKLQNDQESILDANLGLLIINPTEDEVAIAKERASQYRLINQEAYEKRFEATRVSRSNLEVKVYANVTDLESAKYAKDQGADGVGLLRSEFLFKEREPTIDEQTKAYRDIFKLFDEMTIRTLDVGGDKALPYIKIATENNPFLGIRGIRLLETHPEIIQTQLKAILRAAKGRAIKIMFPMISTPQEFIHARQMTLKIAQKYKLSSENVKFGIMIEVPSVLFQLDDFNALVDFYSIGTNDLTQYLFAIERTHPTLSTDPLSPALLEALAMIKEKTTKPVSICGEVAGLPEAIPKLLELGFTSLSMTPSQIPLIKETIRHA
jgi:phosphocarrier protein FPr